MTSKSGKDQADQVALLFIGVVILLCVAVALLWVAGQLSSVVTGNGWPASTFSTDLGPIVKAWKDAPGDPASAWPPAAAAVIGPAWLVYLIFVFLLLPVALIATAAIRATLNWRRRRGLRLFRLGFASGYEIRKLMGRRAIVRRGRKVRPRISRQRLVHPLQVGFFLGRDYRSQNRLYSSVEDAVLIIAPPRQGKDVHFCTPFTIDAPGASVVVASGIEAFTNTYQQRARMGKVFVFDPNRMTNWPDRLRWSPVRGSESPDAADDRAKTFIKQAGFTPGDEGSYAVVSSAIVILRCYLHAAALHGRGIRDVLRWASDPTNPEPVDLLRRAEEATVAATGWASELEAAMKTDPATRGARWAVVVQSMSCLFEPATQAECSPDPGEELDVRDFVSGRNTLYVLAKEKGVNPATPLVTIMIEDLFGRMRATAAQMPGGRLEPPASFELNEAGTILPMGSLPRFMGLLGRSSIAVHVYVRSLSQARAAWGKDGASHMWDNAAVRIIAGGAGNIDDLEEVSKLLGDAYLPDGKAVGRRILTADEIRTMRFGTAVVVGRETRPVEVVLTPWWKRADKSRIAAGKAATEAKILQYNRSNADISKVAQYIRSQD